MFKLSLSSAEKRGHVAVVYCGEELAGFAALSTFSHEKKSAIFNRILVRPQFRRQGYGSALVSVLTDAAREQGMFGVRAFVPPAEAAFWAAQSFQAWRHNDYGPSHFGKVLAPPLELPDGPRIPVQIEVEGRSEAGVPLLVTTYHLEAVETEPGVYALNAEVPLVAQWPNDAHAHCFWVKLADREPVKHSTDIMSYIYGADRLPLSERNGNGDIYVLKRIRDKIDMSRV